MVNEKRHRAVIAGLLAAAALAAPVTLPAAVALAETAESGTSQESTFDPNSAPEGVEAKDRTYNLTAVSSDIKFEKTSGYFDDLYVNGASGKFQGNLSGGNVQVNPGTKLYIPIAEDSQGAYLTILGTQNDVAVSVDGNQTSFGSKVFVSTDSARYVEVVFGGTGSSYLTSISIDYVSDTSTYPGTPEGVSATDTTWNLAISDSASGTHIEKERGEFQNIKIDADEGKFATGSANTQVNSHTVLYIPVAQDASGATLRINGNNDGNLTIKVDGKEVSLGKDVIIDASSTRYVRVDFNYDGVIEAGKSRSAYLTSISIDYASDNEEAHHVVNVGPGQEYTTISDALKNETSSLKDHLVLNIMPGFYNEQVIVNKPGVIFQNANPENGEVIIHDRRYSSNTFDKEGHFISKDDYQYDLGTEDCGTVRVEAGATGFQAYNITFQNDYNVTYKTDAGTQTPAVAFKSSADKVVLKNCRFIGRQDTMYLQGSGNRVYLEDCYVEGTVDFVFGDADAYFTDCELHMTTFPGRKSGYFTAANTKAGYAGLAFVGCDFTADPSLETVSLGRPWQNLCSYTVTTDEDGTNLYSNIDHEEPLEDYESISSAATLVGCSIPENVIDAHWSQWMGHSAEGNHEMVSITYDPTVRFSEYASTCNGTLVTSSEGLYLGGTGGKFDSSANVDEVSKGLLSDMAIGGAWNPASFSPIEVPETPIDPNPGTGTTTPGGGAGTTTPSEPSFEPTVEEAAHGSTSISTEAPHAGDTVTITPDPDEGYEVRNVTVTDADGNEVEVTENEDGTWSFEQPEDEVIITVTYGCDGGDHCVSHEFADLDSSQWYHDGVDWAISEGLMSGYGDGSDDFGPADTLSRGQLATVLWRQAGEPEADASKVSQFVDCDQDAFYAQAVAWCVEQGIFTGFDETHFGPAETMDREQLATVLWRQAGSPEVSADLSGYPDASDVAAFAQDAMNWAVQTGALSGQGSTGELDPLGSLERGQAATILMRLAEK